MTTSTPVTETMPTVALAYYQIPEPNFAALEEKINKLSRRSKRFGMGEITLNVTAVTPHESNQYNLLTVELKGAEPVVTGWYFVASITHDHETGNIIRYTPPFTAAEVAEKYRTTGAICEHCKLNRQRKDTYVVRHKDTAEEKQVGRTCLGEFFNGANPHHIAEYSEMLGNIGLLMDDAKNPPVATGAMIRKPLFYSLKTVLTAAATVIRMERGFVSGGQAYNDRRLVSTASIVKDILWAGSNPGSTAKYIPTSVDANLAEAAIEWGAGVEASNDYLWNVRVLCTSEMLTAQQIGLAVSIVGVYLRESVKPVGESNYVGTLNEKLTFTATLRERRGTQFSTLYTFVDAAGNVIKTFTNSDLKIEVGQSGTFTGTVVEHKEWKGVKETIVKRPTVGAPKGKAMKAAPADIKQFDQIDVPF
jgi:hypothetical protein